MSIGTFLYTWLYGYIVGEDNQHNKYYCNSKNFEDLEVKRWVVFKGEIESTKIPPEWHAWLHYTVDEPLTQIAANSYSWQEAHEVNHTGTGDAYRPKGHDYKGGRRGSATGDYEAWKPD